MMQQSSYGEILDMNARARGERSGDAHLSRGTAALLIGLLSSGLWILLMRAAIGG